MTKRGIHEPYVSRCRHVYVLDLKKKKKGERASSNNESRLESRFLFSRLGSFFLFPNVATALLLLSLLLFSRTDPVARARKAFLLTAIIRNAKLWEIDA